MARGDVVNHHRNHEWGNFFWATVTEEGVLLFQRSESPDSRADKNASSVEVESSCIKTCVFPRFACGCHREVGIAIRSANVFGVFKGRGRVKIPDFACDTTVISRGVESGNGGNATLPADQAGPSLGEIVGERGKGPQSCHYNATRAHKRRGARSPTGKDFRSGRIRTSVIWTACPRCTLQHRRQSGVFPHRCRELRRQILLQMP